MIRVAVDAMGGDRAPGEIVKGCAMAVRSVPDVYVYAVGRQEDIEKILAGEEYDHDRLEIVDTREVIEMGDVPTLAIRRKKDSSLVTAMRLVKEGRADAVVSCGNTGAVLVGAQAVVGRKPGIERSPLATMLPTAGRFSLLIDCGANVDAKPEYLHTFAKLGSEYYARTMHIERPRVALVNIGAESEKGNELSKATYPLLQKSGLNFTGNIEPRDIPSGAADVVVCDGFTGNVILKLVEGLASMLLGMIKTELMSSWLTKIGAALSMPAFRSVKKRLDYTEEGGAPLLGVKGAVIKAHGSSNATAIKNALFQAARMVEGNIVGIIEEQVAKLKSEAESAQD